MLTNVFDTDTNFDVILALLVGCDWHQCGVVVWHVAWGSCGVLEDQADLTELGARWTDLVDTVVVEVVDFPILSVGRCIRDQCEHELVTNDGCGEVVRVCALNG